jgi:hypothetical protein
VAARAVLHSGFERIAAGSEPDRPLEDGIPTPCALGLIERTVEGPIVAEALLEAALGVPHLREKAQANVIGLRCFVALERGSGERDLDEDDSLSATPAGRELQGPRSHRDGAGRLGRLRAPSSGKL